MLTQTVSVFLLFTRFANVVQLFIMATVVTVHSMPTVVNVCHSVRRAACGVRRAATLGFVFSPCHTAFLTPNSANSI